MNRAITALSASLFLATAGVAAAQTPSTPGTSPSTRSTAPATPSTPGMASPGSSTAGTATSGQHSMNGEITKVDNDKGWVHVKTDKGTMIMQVPAASVKDIKKGDKVRVSLGFRDEGPRADKDADRPQANKR